MVAVEIMLRVAASTTWVHEICRDTGVSATEALLLAEDKLFWQTTETIAMTGGSG